MGALAPWDPFIILGQVGSEGGQDNCDAVSQGLIESEAARETALDLVKEKLIPVNGTKFI